MHEIGHLIIGAVIGGLIGYFTNFLAIRMLFRPHTEKRIGQFRIPLTPGVIPRRKDKLAGEIGKAVSAKVFTDLDIREIFSSDRMKQTVTDGMLFFVTQKKAENTPGSLMEQYLSEEERDRLTDQTDAFLKEKVSDALCRHDMSQRIAYECKGQIRDRIRGTAAARVITEDKIETLADYLGRYLQHYIRAHIDDLIMPILREEYESVLSQPVGTILNDIGASERMLERATGNIYDEFMEKYGADIAAEFDIAGLTERKIISFRPEEIEALVNRTIKREMQAVINLGGVLGVIIGFVASFL